jgi:outer membrane protein assembly factor BamB
LKRALAAAILVILVLGVAGGVWYYKHETRRREKLGAATEEFDPNAAPGSRPPPSKQPQRHRKELVYVEPWPTYGYDDVRSHLAPYAIRPPYRRVWTVRTGYYIEFPPAVAYGRVFLSQLHGRFFAIEARTGHVMWQKRFARYCSAASPTVGQGVVYETYLPRPCDHGDRSRSGLVVAMRAKGGSLLWRLRIASESSPLLRGHLLYFGAWDHKLYAVDVRTHKVRWTFEGDAELNSSPAYASGTIYIGSDGGSLYAVNARTGRLRWQAHSYSRFGRREYFYATPTIAYGRVYIGNTDGTMYSYGASTGHLVWAQPAGTYVYTGAAVWSKTVYVGSYDGNVYAFDAATGRLRWKYSSPGSIHGAPTVMGGLVYFSTCGTCGRHGSRYAKLGPRTTFALNARTGTRVWSFPDGRYAPLVADGQRVYLTGNTREYALVPLRRKVNPRSTAARG